MRANGFRRYFDFSSLLITVINSTRDAGAHSGGSNSALMRVEHSNSNWHPTVGMLGLYQFARENFGFDCIAIARECKTEFSSTAHGIEKPSQEQGQGRAHRALLEYDFAEDKHRRANAEERQEEKKPLCEWYVRHVISLDILFRLISSIHQIQQNFRTRKTEFALCSEIIWNNLNALKIIESFYIAHAFAADDCFCVENNSSIQSGLSNSAFSQKTHLMAMSSSSSTKTKRMEFIYQFIRRIVATTHVARNIRVHR